ncbi:MAG: leucine-rich repeat domain-containing protein [Cyanobacteria bacterium J06638_28]
MLKAVQPLASLTNLERLDLYLNQITDVSALATLTKLETLVLSENPLDEFTCPVEPATICR